MKNTFIHVYDAALHGLALIQKGQEAERNQQAQEIAASDCNAEKVCAHGLCPSVDDGDGGSIAPSAMTTQAVVVVALANCINRSNVITCTCHEASQLSVNAHIHIGLEAVGVVDRNKVSKSIISMRHSGLSLCSAAGAGEFGPDGLHLDPLLCCSDCRNIWKACLSAIYGLEEIQQRLNRLNPRVVTVVICDLAREGFCNPASGGYQLPAGRASVTELALEVVNDWFHARILIPNLGTAQAQLWDSDSGRLKK